MGSLSNLYISQSYQSLIHLATNNTASATLIGLEDGLGNSIGVSVNTAGNLFLSGTFSASLQEGYLYVGNASGRTIAFPTASLVTNINTGSLVTTSSFNAYTASTNIRLSNIELTTASVLVSISNLNASSASQQISIDALNAFTASQSTASIVSSITQLNQFTQSADIRLNNLESTSASVNTSIANINQYTQSNDLKWQDLGNKSGSWITESETGSFARYDVSNPWSADQTFTNITAFSASFTYVKTIFETASVIYSSGSNQLGDELTDVQTLSGSVLVRGGLFVNDIDVTSSLNSINVFTASANSRLNNLEAATSSYAISASVAAVDAAQQAQIDSLIAATSSYVTEAESGSFLITASFNNGTRNLTFTKGDASTFAVNIPDVSGSVDTGSFATTGSNVFRGDQVISGSGSGTDALKVNGYLTLKNVPGNLYTYLDIQATNPGASGGGVSITNTGAGTYLLDVGTYINGFTFRDGSANNTIFSVITGSNTPVIFQRDLVITGSTDISGDLSASLQQGYVWVGNGAGRTSLVPTSSFIDTFNSSSLVTTASFNTYTQSTDNRLANIETATASINISITNLNNFTASIDTNFVSEAEFGAFTSSVNTFTQSADNRLNNIEAATGSYAISASVAAVDAAQQQQIDSLINATGSYVTETESGSFLITASFASQTLTFTKGDGTTFGVLIPDVSGSTIDTGSFVTTSSFNAYTASNDQRVGSLESNSASVNISISNINLFTQSADQRLDSIEGQSGSWVTSAITASSIITASVSDDDITFTKGDGSTFTIQVATGSYAVSASYAETASLAINALTASIARNLIVIARNGGASTLPAGTVVHITSAVGDNPIFTTASYDTEALSGNTFGLLRYSSPAGADVEVVVAGVVTGVDTNPANGYTAGDIVYLSSSGQFTNIQPQAPNQIVTLGQVLRAQQNNGSIYVSINNGWELDELHNVQINSPQTGDLIQYESSSYGLWKNKSIAGAGITTTSSFNAYTQSTDNRLTNIESTTASLNTAVTNINSFTQSANGRLNSLEAATSSYVTETESGSFLITGSVAGNVLTFTKGDNTTFNLTVATGSGGGGSIDTGSFATTGSNTFFGSETFNVSPSDEFRVNWGSASSASLYTENSGGPNQTLNLNSASLYINRGGLFFSSGSFTVQTGDMQFNSYPSASFTIRTQYGGDAILRSNSDYTNNSLPYAYFRATPNGGAEIIGFGGNVVISGSGTTIQGVDFIPFSASLDTRINSITGSGTTDTGSLLVTASFNTSTRNITFTKGDASTFNLGGFATTGSNTFTDGQAIFANNALLISGSNGFGYGITLQGAQGIKLEGTGGPRIEFPNSTWFNGNQNEDLIFTADTDNPLTRGLDFFLYGSGSQKIRFRNNSGPGATIQFSNQSGSISFTAGSTISMTGSSLQLQGLTYPNVDGTNGQVLTTNGAGTLSFTTVSGGTTYTNPTLNPYSGSLILAANTTSTASLAPYITASNNGQVNLMFLNRNLSGGVYVSGSSNIFPNPNIPSAGRINYLGGSSNVLLTSFTANNTQAFPTMTGSTAAIGGIYPAMNGNILMGQGAWTINTSNNPGIHNYNNNILNGTTTFNMLGNVQVAGVANSGRFDFTGNTSAGTFLINSPSRSLAETAAGATGSVRLTITNNNVQGTFQYNGPVSGSTANIHNINQNIVAGTLQLNLQSGSKGYTVSSNVLGGSLVVNDNVAFTPTLGSSATINNNNINGNVTINSRNSSSLNVTNNNINSWTISSDLDASAVTTAVVRTGQLAANALFGTIGNNILFSGSSTGGTTKAIAFNLMAGSNISASVGGGEQALQATSVLGTGLHVFGTSILNTSNQPLGGERNGSLFAGRWNALDGTRGFTAETIFAVGTGNSGSAGIVRKTGFLIDSGSNTFIEGTLNVSGSTTITGSLTLSSSAAIELDVVGNSQFTGSLTVSGSATVTGSVNISNVIQLAQLDPLPAGATGQLAVSQSLLWFYDATQWKQVSLV